MVHVLGSQYMSTPRKKIIVYAHFWDPIGWQLFLQKWMTTLPTICPRLGFEWMAILYTKNFEIGPRFILSIDDKMLIYIRFLGSLCSLVLFQYRSIFWVLGNGNSTHDNFILVPRFGSEWMATLLTKLFLYLQVLSFQLTTFFPYHNFNICQLFCILERFATTYTNILIQVHVLNSQGRTTLRS